jgi:phosphopantothenate-cysteine ligase
LKILITSGGTKIPIDSVRSITNMSNGTFGAKIAKGFLSEGDQVTFLTHKSAKTPVKTEIDLKKEIDFNALLKEYQWVHQVLPNYWEIQYNTFEEYARELELRSRYNQFDAILLACAASDYGVPSPMSGKIRSSSQMNIELEPLPKLISKIRGEWDFKGVLVGFKLLVGVEKSELIDAARKSCIENGCNFVIANDLNDIKAGNHRIIIVSKDNDYVVSKEESVSQIIDNVNKEVYKRLWIPGE